MDDAASDAQAQAGVLRMLALNLDCGLDMQMKVRSYSVLVSGLLPGFAQEHGWHQQLTDTTNANMARV
jgi:hypothetical protein